MAGNIKLMSSTNCNTRSGVSNTSMNSMSMSGSPAGPGLAMKKPRRLWTLHDRSAVSVNLLKANLAQDGCEEAQLNVAKKLLNDTSDDSTGTLNENARLAIYWLIKSSEQGNEEATDLLKNCLESSRGINCQNIIDVQMCIDTPRNEKLTIKAARLLYEKLNNGEDFITTTQLGTRLLQIMEAKNVSFEVDQSLSQDRKSVPQPSSLRHQFEDFDEPVSTANSGDSSDKRHKSQNSTEAGASRKRRNSSSLTDLDTSCKGHCHNFSKHQGIKLTDEEMVKNAKIYNTGGIPSILINPPHSFFNGMFHHWSLTSYTTVSFLQLLVLTFVWGNISLSSYNILFAVNSVLGLWSCYNMLGWHWSEPNFSDWTILFKNVLREENWSEATPAIRFYRNYLRPYLLTSLLCASIFLFYNNIPHGNNAIYSMVQLFIGSATMSSLFYTFRLYKKLPSWEFTLLLVFQLIPTFNVLLSNSFPEYIKYVWENNIDLWNEYFPELFFLSKIPPQYFNLTSILKMTQVFLFIKLVVNSVGTAKVNYGQALSEVVFILWMVLIIHIPQHFLSNNEYMFVASGIILLGLLLMTLKSLYSINLWKLLTGICVVIIITLLILTTLFQVDISRLDFITTSESKFIRELLKSVQKQTDEREPFSLSWEEYDLNCHQTAWKLHNLGYTQLTCPLKYENQHIRWKGSVAMVKLEQNRQSLKEDGTLIFQILVSMNENTKETSSDSWKNFIPLQIDRFLHHDKDSLHPTVSLRIPTTKSSTFYKKLITHLLSFRSGDEIEFSGKLENNVGGILPEVTSIDKLKCIRCSIADYGELELIDDSTNQIQYYFEYICALFSDSIQYSWRLTYDLFSQIVSQANLDNSISPIADD